MPLAHEQPPTRHEEVGDDTGPPVDVGQPAQGADAGEHERDDHQEYAVVHILRFDGAKIAEMWDIGQEIPKDSPNALGMF